MKEKLEKINNITVLGAGISGREVVRWAISQGKKVLLSDNKPLSSLSGDFIDFCRLNNVYLETGGHTIDSIKDASLVVASPGISPDLDIIKEIKKRQIPIMGEIDLAIRLWDGPVIGITGTNGKTTTTSLTGCIFKNADIPVAVAGNIGKPLIGYVADGNTRRVAVLEISSFQIDCFSELNDFGSPVFTSVAITNITPDHLDRYKSFENYINSKFKVCDFLKKDGYLVLNSNLLEFEDRFKEKTNNMILFGDNPKGNYFAKIDNNTLITEIPGKSQRFNISKWRLKGSHNLENLACAAILGLINNVEGEAIQGTINNFKAPAHRIQFVEKINNVEYYNDSKATNVASVMKALDAISNPVALIAGGRGKGESYLPLKSYALSKRLKAAILIGEEAESLRNVFEDIIPVIMINSKKNGFEAIYEAVSLAKEMAAPNDAVLLSPACASFDMFKNYEERGDAFMKAVADIKEKYEGR